MAWTKVLGGRLWWAEGGVQGAYGLAAAEQRKGEWGARAVPTGKRGKWDDEELRHSRRCKYALCISRAHLRQSFARELLSLLST
jgi:hypothetical protein